MLSRLDRISNVTDKRTDRTALSISHVSIAVLACDRNESPAHFDNFTNLCREIYVQCTMITLKDSVSKIKYTYHENATYIVNCIKMCSKKVVYQTHGNNGNDK